MALDYQPASKESQTLRAAAAHDRIRRSIARATGPWERVQSKHPTCWRSFFLFNSSQYFWTGLYRLPALLPMAVTESNIALPAVRELRPEVTLVTFPKQHWIANPMRVGARLMCFTTQTMFATKKKS